MKKGGIEMKRKKKRWIQKAVKKKGNLKKWLQKNIQKVKKLIGMSPFRKDGKISLMALKRLGKHPEVPLKIRKRINLAITLHKLRKLRKRKK